MGPEEGGSHVSWRPWILSGLESAEQALGTGESIFQLNLKKNCSHSMGSEEIDLGSTVYVALLAVQLQLSSCKHGPSQGLRRRCGSHATGMGP